VKIEFVDIQNFRKLKCSRVHLSNKETLFVGANNSGKTSAMDALISFLDQKSHRNSSSSDGEKNERKFHTTDFTLSNWNKLNEYAESWLDSDGRSGELLSDWQCLCPSIDIWLNVNVEEVHFVSHLIPTLKWRGGSLGVRLIYQPKDIESLIAEFVTDFSAAKDVLEKLKEKIVEGKEDKDKEGTKLDEHDLTLWPRDIKDFLNKKLSTHFEIKAYILDPSKIEVDYKNQLIPQTLNVEQLPLETYPFKNLFKVDIIEAQRGFSDPNSVNSMSSGSVGSLSGQLNQYYARHLDPNEQPDENDVEALNAIDFAKTEFDLRLNDSFKDALKEIKGLGYPGFNDPDITLCSKVNPVESLNHDAAVVFDLKTYNKKSEPLNLSLPEKYNGLGYKNLIYMIFKLIVFRDHWMRKGKASRRKVEEDFIKEPLHIVLIEEPEAHLHAQVQQVFIRKAFSVLRKDVDEMFSTQLIVSSHSSYIAHEVGFEKLRYFKRKPADDSQIVPYADVVDLSKIFGTKDDDAKDTVDTAKFVARYLKTTHCDLFFANGIIMVEGAAERMLIPHFIREHYDKINGLDRSYISILEVGGAHAQRLKPLIEALGLPTLVITDTDAVDKDGKKTMPSRNDEQKTGSNTLKSWFNLKDKSLDEILNLPFEKKIYNNVCAVYQYGIKLKFKANEDEQEAIPYTFEDALALSNTEVFRTLSKPRGMLKKMKAALDEDDLGKCCAELYDALKGEKAKMALDLLFDIDPSKLIVPSYIDDGLNWLQNELEVASKDYIDVVEQDFSND